MSEEPKAATPPPASSDEAPYACPKCGCTSFIVSSLHTFTRRALDAVESRPGFAALTTLAIPLVSSEEYRVYCANCRLTAIRPRVVVT